MLLLAVENVLNQSKFVAVDFMTLTVMMTYIQKTCVAAMRDFTVYAERLMYLLAGVDLIIAVLLNLEEADHLKVLVKKVIKYGFFIYLIKEYPTLLNKFLDGFIFFGKMSSLKALQPLAEGLVTNPAVIATYGIYLVKDALNVIIQQGTSTITSDPVLLMNIGILLAIAGSYFMVGLNLFLLYVEFYVLGALSVVLIPFGVNQYTSFISQKVLNAMVTIGIKMMVTVFIIGLVMPFVMMIQPLGVSASKIEKGMEQHQKNIEETNKERAAAADPSTIKDKPHTLENYLYLLLPSLAVAFLSIHGPNMAMTLLSGGGSTFNASTAAGSMMAMARLPQTLQGFGVGAGDNKTKELPKTTLDAKIGTATKTQGVQDANVKYDNSSYLTAQNMKNKVNNKTDKIG